MPEIIWDSREKGQWVPALNKILMSDEPYFKRRGPMVMAHEIGHWKYDQTLGGTNPYVDLLEERDAWRFALSKLPPEEIDLDFLEDTLSSYVDEVECWYGEGYVLDSAKAVRNDIMWSAKRKKGGY